MQRSLGTHPYRRGLLDLGRGCYAWLQPDGGWGWSNAGLVVDGDQSLLVDTLFDVGLTAEMLFAMRNAEPRAASRIDVVVNTHSNGDHTNGNELVADAEIISSTAAIEEMKRDVSPAQMAELIERAPSMGDAGRYFARAFSPFEFKGVRPQLPGRGFEGRLDLRVGAKPVELIQAGPAHTAGDVVAWVPGSRTVFTGDILFVDGTPIIWAGPVANWIAACDRICALEPEVVVPGHGPVTDVRGVQAVRAYLVYVRDQARARFDAGLSAFDAAADIELGDFSAWGDRERIVVNVASLYREFSQGQLTPNVIELFGQMERYLGKRARAH
jgi:glyoxylase-like metal-dependent hydrolase (beta-lactamase superfamily II)